MPFPLFLPPAPPHGDRLEGDRRCFPFPAPVDAAPLLRDARRHAGARRDRGVLGLLGRPRRDAGRGDDVVECRPTERFHLVLRVLGGDDGLVGRRVPLEGGHLEERAPEQADGEDGEGDHHLDQAESARRGGAADFVYWGFTLAVPKVTVIVWLSEALYLLTICTFPLELAVPSVLHVTLPPAPMSRVAGR